MTYKLNKDNNTKNEKINQLCKLIINKNKSIFNAHSWNHQYLS